MDAFATSKNVLTEPAVFSDVPWLRFPLILCLNFPLLILILLFLFLC